MLDSLSYKPSDFHSQLCERIRSAEKRVMLASLYVGPAANSEAQKREKELLEALSSSSCPDIRILMDRNRGLRPVPKRDGSMTSSAIECEKSLSHMLSTPNIFLFPVLPPWQQRILRNPLDEVAGVFHIKLYIIDDNLIISGANLSEEYFSDRIDRYLWIKAGGNGLVECFASVFDVLCKHGHPHAEGDTHSRPLDCAQLVKDLEDVMTSDSSVPGCDDENVVAFAIPTLQLPPHVTKSCKDVQIPQDSAVLDSLLRELLHLQHESTKRFRVRLSSAYLNLVESFRILIDELDSDLLTAGSLSHGFKAKKKEGNKGKPWIPTVFREISLDLSRKSRVWLYMREGWTFHAKGLWISVDEDGQDSTIEDEGSLCALVHGSSNFGARSTYRDMESNLILLIPPKETPDRDAVKQAFATEWNELLSYAVELQKDDRTYSLPIPNWLRSWF